MHVFVNDIEVSATAGVTLFECAERARVRVPTSCFKNGKCRECLVEVVSGAEFLTEPAPEEKHLQAPYRLSCRARVAATDGRIECHTLRRGAMRIVAAGLPPPRSLDPAVTRNGDQVLLDGNVVAKRPGPLHGLAVDLGTTTVVLRCVDLETGETLQSRSFENPQRFGGTDVMARIHYDSQYPGLLRRTLLGYLNHSIAEFDCDPESIFEIVVAGNPTMRDLFFGLDVHSIGQRPYRSIIEHQFLSGERSETSLECAARKLRLPAHPAARVYGLPLVSGHVGADAAACLLAVDIAAQDRPVALMDIGTNTEFAVGNRDRLFVASCPAGPAFEGGLISCGMPGLDGAIESFRFDEHGRPSSGVIGDLPAQGICGSGLVDLLGELHRTGRMNELGRFIDESDRFVLDAERGVFLTEEDISQLAQAKGANAAGSQIVLKRSGIRLAEIERFYLAGGFGRHLPLDAAKRIGLIPDLPTEKIVQLGNAAIEGATLALLSVSRRRQLEQLVQKAVHVELETDAHFFDHFVEGCQFKPFRDSGHPEEVQS